MSPVCVLFESVTIPCASSISGEHQSLPSTASPLPRAPESSRQWRTGRVWEHSRDRTAFPDPKKSRAKGEDVQGLCEDADAALFHRGPTGTCSCASLKPSHRAFTALCEWAGHSSAGSCRPCALPAAPSSWGTSGQAWTQAGETPLGVVQRGALPGDRAAPSCAGQSSPALPCHRTPSLGRL